MIGTIGFCPGRSEKIAFSEKLWDRKPQEKGTYLIEREREFH